MKQKVNFNSVYIPSEDVVAREIEGELIIVPLTAGIGDMEDELYTMNETGRAIWAGLDGKNTVKTVIAGLTERFQAPAEEIEQDVVGLLEELLKRKMVVEQPGR